MEPTLTENMHIVASNLTVAWAQMVSTNNPETPLNMDTFGRIWAVYSGYLEQLSNENANNIRARSYTPNPGGRSR
jgi:hypothetical protein